MNLRILIYFLTVAREKNLTRAADILHITQPTLSRQLAQLEDELGVKLFDRSQRRLTLSTAGKFLQQRGQEIIELVDKTTLDIQEQEINLKGNICFGAGEIKSVQLLADIIGAFQRQNPQVTFDLFTDTSDMIKNKMEKGLIDIAILQEPIDMVNYDFIRLPSIETFGVLMRADNPLSHKETVTAADLHGQSVLLPTRLQVRSDIINWLSGSIARIHLAGTCHLLGNLAILTARNNYCAITIEPPSMDSQLCFRPLFPPLESRVMLAWKRGAQHSITMQKFIEFARCFLGIVTYTK